MYWTLAWLGPIRAGILWVNAFVGVLGARVGVHRTTSVRGLVKYYTVSQKRETLYSCPYLC